MIVFSNRYCVYAHKHRDEVFYIGAGTSARPFQKYNRNKIWQDIVSDLDGRYEVCIVDWFEKLSDALNYESEQIKKTRPRANIALTGRTSIGLRTSGQRKRIILALRRGQKHEAIANIFRVPLEYIKQLSSNRVSSV